MGLGGASKNFLLDPSNVVEERVQRNRVVGERRDSAAQEWMKGTWMEFHAENAILTFKLSDEAAQLYAPDTGAVACENEVDARVWQHFAHLRQATSEIPTLNPEVLHPSG